MKKTRVARLLGYVTGIVNRQSLLQNEYLIAESRVPAVALAGASPVD